MISFIEAVVISAGFGLVSFFGAFLLGRRYGQWTIHREKTARASAESKLERALEVVESNTAAMTKAASLIDQLNDKVRDYERRWLNAQDAVEVFQKQRDEWRNRCNEQAMLHLAGQQQLETNLVAARTMFQRAVQQWNAERERAEAPPVELKMAELLAPPVGVAADYFERMKALLLSAPKEFDAAVASLRVNEEEFDAALAKAIIEVRLADKRPATGLPPQAEHIAPVLEAS